MGLRKTTYRPGNKGLAYLRVSTSGQVETEFSNEGLSLPAQRRKVHEHAHETHREIVGEYVEPGVTATSIEKRKSYQAVIEHVRTDPTISFVMVYATSRMNRNWEEDAVMGMTLRSYGVRYLSATEDIDDEDADKRAMRGFLAVMNGWQSEKASADIQYKMTQKAVIGGTPGYVPIGYMNVGQQYEGRLVHTVTTDPERAELVTRAFTLFASGQYTIRDLADHLNDSGMTARPNRSRPKRPVTEAIVRRMLANHYYLGNVTWSGVEYDGRHPRLVEPGVFERVQQLLTGLPGNGARQRRYNHYLKGVVWCERCKHRLIVMRGKSQTGELYFYYVCRGRQEAVCDLPYLRVRQVEQAVEAHYHNVRLPGSTRRRLLDLLDDDSLLIQADDQVKREHSLARLTELERAEDRLLDLAAEADMPKSKITEKLRTIRTERSHLRELLNETSERLNRGRDALRTVLTYLDDPHALYLRGGTQTRVKLNRLIFKKLYVDVDEECATLVSSDELTEPFATVVYLRRSPMPDLGVPSGHEHANGPAIDEEARCLLAHLFAEPSSSNEYLVGVTGFEPAASSSRTKRATKLRHTPVATDPA